MDGCGDVTDHVAMMVVLVDCVSVSSCQWLWCDHCGSGWCDVMTGVMMIMIVLMELGVAVYNISHVRGDSGSHCSPDYYNMWQITTKHSRCLSDKKVPSIDVWNVYSVSPPFTMALHVSIV